MGMLFERKISDTCQPYNKKGWGFKCYCDHAWKDAFSQISWNCQHYPITVSTADCTWDVLKLQQLIREKVMLLQKMWIHVYHCLSLSKHLDKLPLSSLNCWLIVNEDVLWVSDIPYSDYSVHTNRTKRGVTLIQKGLIYKLSWKKKSDLGLVRDRCDYICP